MPKPIGVGQTQHVGPYPTRYPNMLPVPCWRYIAGRAAYRPG
jgi:hypothetical protein